MQFCIIMRNEMANAGKYTRCEDLMWKTIIYVDLKAKMIQINFESKNEL